MTSRYQLYWCPICGTVSEVLHDGVSAMVCCGQMMQLLDDREPVGAKESHIPVLTADGSNCKVAVGSKLHEMVAEHLIEWVEIRTKGNEVMRRYFNPGDEPVAVFPVPLSSVVFARSYCNKHHAWRAKL